jgi:hypothetical protein
MEREQDREEEEGLTEEEVGEEGEEVELRGSKGLHQKFGSGPFGSRKQGLR